MNREQKNALEAIKGLSFEAAQVLEEILNDKKTSPSVRLRAVEMVIERTYGKPQLPVDISTTLPTEAQKEIDRLLEEFKEPC